jgi:hypothetical protein
MAAVIDRPRLVSFRVEAFQSENRVEGSASTWTVELKQEIQVGLAVPSSQVGVLQAVVKIELVADAHDEAVPDQTARFRGEYIGKLNYPAEATEAQVIPVIDQEDHQYLLVAQVFPLAMVHFRRELQATGFDGRHLPLGI